MTVAIIARDEERHIADAIRSVQGLAAEVLVLLDDRSRDATKSISERLGARVEIEAWQNFSVQRNRALAYCQTEWLLFLDADERVTPELYHELEHVLRQRVGSGGVGEGQTRDTSDETQDTRHLSLIHI